MNSLAGKTVLLTGATGFIGSHLHRRLATLHPAKLVLVSRRAAHLSAPNEVTVTSGLDELSSATWDAAGVQAFDLVLHLGAFTPKSASTADDIEENFRANLLGTRALLDSLPKTPEKLVFSSTLDVYRPPAVGEVLTEESPLAPASLYGASKLFGEHLVAAYARRTGCATAVLRYGHIYGPGEDAYAKLIPNAIRALHRNESPIVYGDGSVLRDFLYVDDAVEATLRAALSPVSSDPINIVSGSSRPVREIVEFLRSLRDGAPAVTYHPEKPGGRSLQFSAGRMHRELGDWPLVPLETGLSREFASMGQRL